MVLFKGAGVALVTPFNAAGEINYDTYEKMIRFQVENGIDAIVSCGTTGEASTLSDDEHTGVVRAAVEITKAVTPPGKTIPVIAGAGSNDTRHAIHLCKALEKAGADACMLVSPYYNKTSQRGIIEHFTAVAKSVDIPIVLYNIPSRTGLNIKPATLEALGRIENIVAIKEASFDFVQCAEYVERCGDRISIYSGNDEVIVPVLSLGGHGVISTVANVLPGRTHELVVKYQDGDVAGSARLQIEMLPLIRALFADVNPIPVKAAVNLMGFDAGGCRLPLTTLDDDLLENLKIQLKRFGVMQ